MIIRRYSQMAQMETFEERFEYLKLGGVVGEATFGFDRHINQKFYRSTEWKTARRDVIVRDGGCDLGIPGREINGELLVHHINPLSLDDIVHAEEWILDPEFLVCTTKDTHNAIHYGDASLLPREFVPRAPGDTKLW